MQLAVTGGSCGSFVVQVGLDLSVASVARGGFSVEVGLELVVGGGPSIGLALEVQREDNLGPAQRGARGQVKRAVGDVLLDQGLRDAATRRETLDLAIRIDRSNE